ncbi:hypothetical protein [Bradyrhizobium mercantei]|uniref:hypothetical protein n=1 Tax=Bradyrhizobium mercantei TaxID=1904807 RepID=UPI0013565A52|nr:hypothetical protein [Bradyrhizobium mercantei]
MSYLQTGKLATASGMVVLMTKLLIADASPMPDQPGAQGEVSLIRGHLPRGSSRL